ncbi:MAG TPA: transcriptional regulator, partial [Agrobacterium sp.]|nr:transcriptional regulator [Agrobacterium sp.]
MDTLQKTIHNSEYPVVCRSCEARHGGLCSTLTPQQLCDLNRHSSRKKLEAGNELLAQGELVSSYGNILNGVVKLSKM